MELTSLCLVLCSLTIRPDRSQFFSYDIISLSCAGPSNSTRWTVKRNTTDEAQEPCESSWGKPQESSCTIEDAYPSDSGVYWCESGEGERSNAVNVTVTRGTVIMESPVFPVREEEEVTLRCLYKEEYMAQPSTDVIASFYKDGAPIRTGESTGEVIFPAVSKSDEGVYKCTISGRGESPGSWLAVKATVPSQTISPAPLMSLPRLVCSVLVVIPYIAVTIALAMYYRQRRTYALAKEKKTSCDDIIMV